MLPTRFLRVLARDIVFTRFRSQRRVVVLIIGMKIIAFSVSHTSDWDGVE